MAKILIGLYVPSIEEKFDLFVPTDLPIGELCTLLANGLEQATDGHYKASGNELLCLVRPDQLLSRAQTLDEYMVENGDQLALF